ncbi:hypothetical protein [Stutzerimonas kunmingensis]|jgi:predicted DNA-binding protein|uniref:Uncharacterized protein n=1 Tax=Pakpunavirus sp. TaxID=2833053 RepID=A0AB39BYY8_9CAUD|nr:hypothetical protein [Stutzerimonas kunmingensis]
MYANSEDKRSIPRKVRFSPAIDRILQKASHRAGMQHATFLYELIEFGIENGALDELIREHQRKTTAA